MTHQQISQQLSHAISLHQSGNLDDAESIYREVLKAEPQQTKALAMLGLAQLQRGNLPQGIDLLQASLQASPEQPDVLNNLGQALLLTGNPLSALEKFDQALTLAPNYLGALFNRGNALHDLKRFDDAASSFEKAIALKPDYVDAYLNLGNALKEANHLEKALQSYERASTLAAFRPDVHYNHGLLLQEFKRYKEALACFDKAISLAPDFPEARNSRGFVLQRLKHFQEALESHERAIALKPDYADAHCQKGMAQQELGLPDQARASFDLAIKLDPNFAAAYTSRARLFMEQGMMSAAEQDLDTAIKVDPDYLSSYAALASLKKYTEDDPRFEQLTSFYARRTELPRNDQIELNFAMGRTWENQKKFDEAFSAYAEGNELHWLDHPYDEKAAIETMEWITSAFDSNFFEKFSEVSASLPPVSDERTPIFIVGMPRSGTTLIEQILASHPALFGAGELNNIDRIIMKNQMVRHNNSDWAIALKNFRNMGQQYLDEVWKHAPDASYITDKMPDNFRYLGMIHLMLPNAKFIHAMRDPMDSCFSCFSLNFSGNLDFTYDLGVLGRYYQRYIKLMEHWHKVLPAGRILDVRYEDTVADIETQARRILDYLELPWDPACLKFYETQRPVTTASVTQVRQPIYSSSVARWKRFEKHLGPLLEEIGHPTSPNKQ